MEKNNFPRRVLPKQLLSERGICQQMSSIDSYSNQIGPLKTLEGIRT